MAFALSFPASLPPSCSVGFPASFRCAQLSERSVLDVAFLGVGLGILGLGFLGGGFLKRKFDFLEIGI